jgi:hypothetical protein
MFLLKARGLPHYFINENLPLCKTEWLDFFVKRARGDLPIAIKIELVDKASLRDQGVQFGRLHELNQPVRYTELTALLR